MLVEKPPIPPLAGPALGAIPSMSLQPMLPGQQAQPYGPGSSQQFQPLGHANVAIPQPSQIQFPQPMQQVTGRPVVGRHSMPQGPPIPQDFQRNFPMSNNHMPAGKCRFFCLPVSEADNDHRFPSGVQPWMPISNHNVNFPTTMRKTGELAAPLVVLEANYVFDPVETIQSDWIKHTTRKGKKYVIPLFDLSTIASMIRRGNILFSWILYSHKVQLFINSKLVREKDTISHASDFGSISVVKTSSPGADGSLVSAHGAKSSPIAVSLAANLPTILASESSSLSGKVSSMMIETVEMKNSSEPSSPAVGNSEKIGIAVTLGNSVMPPVSETTSAQDAVVYGDGFSPENREYFDVKKDAGITEIGSATPSDEKIVELGPLVYESKAEAKSAFKTLLDSTNIGSDCTWDQAMRAVINDWRYGALKSLDSETPALAAHLGWGLPRRVNGGFHTARGISDLNMTMPPRRNIDQSAQADEVRPTHGMRTHNRAFTPEPVPTPGVALVPTSPPRAPHTNVNRPPTD
ncbi:hypothetical protein CQW23_29578 [Capsicum baccatum]|uniref:FF domain-containing protein n=1 Tax=Capsicum baccatum TaxID=33114 RepID=A0A2G2VJQ3_CAPBA|nr:hypothetical protein CQW23_29578 [Capsicum baccatum]